MIALAFGAGWEKKLECEEEKVKGKKKNIWWFLGDSHSESGFSLVELLISSFLFIIVMLAVLTLFTSQGKVSREANQRTDLMANARAAMDLLTQDIRVAGAGLPEGAVYTFIDGDKPSAGGVGDGTVAGSDDASTYPDYIAMMAAPGEGAPCAFNLSEANAAGWAQGTTLDVPAPPGGSAANLKVQMDACAHTYHPAGSTHDIWLVQSDVGAAYTIITADGANPYTVNGTNVDITHTASSTSSAINLPSGLPGDPSTEAFRGGKLRLANDYRLVAYRIAGQGTDHPVLQRAMADSGNPTLTNFQNVAENVEDLQFAFAYLNSAGEDNNLSGYMETDGGGKSPSFRYPASYNSPSTAASTDQPHRIRYIRVSIVVRTDQIDLNRVG